jgi:exodeoxyribonuclease VII large subunit
LSERLPFDPTRIPSPATPPETGFAEVTTLSVRQVNELVRGALTRYLPATLHVLGEISNLSRPTSGHVYFTLKDDTSELRCVLWRGAAVRLKFAPEDGMQVIATGNIEVYARRGFYQLIARRLEPRGVGALEVAFRQLKERLEREGLFDPRRKKPLPRIPQRIAVVTSPTGAAIRDILQTLARRFPALEILVFPVRVQGAGAAEEIAAAIRALNEHAHALGRIDVLIAGRGGGSLEDLWAFNEEVVARAIAASRIPVVSAVGHEVDVTISDLVADVRAPTPTAAAELITPTLAELADALDRNSARLTRAARQALQLAAARLQTTLAYDGLARPLARLRHRGQLIDELHQRLRLASGELLRRAREQLNAAVLRILHFGTGACFAQLGRALEQRTHRLWRALHMRALVGERRLTLVLGRLQQVSPASRLKLADEHVQQAQARTQVVLRSMLAHHRRLLAVRMEAITACNPRQVLQRGYSLTRDARTRELIRSIRQVHGKQRISTELSDGEFRSTADDPKQGRLFE